jgi:uncharacterized protein DUF955
MSRLSGITAMPGLSMACVEALAESVLSVFQPQALATPQAVEVAAWVDTILPRFGIHVMPAADDELRDCAALTYPSAEGESEILVAEWIWHDLAHDARPNFARATVMHELGHAILHVPIIRTMANAEPQPPAADAVPLPAFNDPEWQAWALAGAILMPRRTITMLAHPTAQAVADTYQVSEQFAAVHLRRLKIAA